MSYIDWCIFLKMYLLNQKPSESVEEATFEAVGKLLPC